MRQLRLKRKRRCLLVSTVALVVVTISVPVEAPVASAAVPSGPHWAVIAQPAPTSFHPGDQDDFYEVIALNDGGSQSTGEITFTDTLPVGVTAREITSSAEEPGDILGGGGSHELTCTLPPATGTITCSILGSVPAGRTVTLKINVEVSPSAYGSLINTLTIASGGEHPAKAAVTNSTDVTSSIEPISYGVTLATDLVQSSGALDAQAGSHPFSFTTLFAFNVGSVNSDVTCAGSRGCARQPADVKDLEVVLPAGLVGNPTAVPFCTQAQFHSNSATGCPAYSQVGGMYLSFFGAGAAKQYAPIYNVEPPPGQPAELGFSVSSLAHIPIFFHVRSDGDYGLTADISDITEFLVVRMAVLSIWGVPAAEAHDEVRESTLEECASGGCASKAQPEPFLTLPTSCPGTPSAISVAGDSWQAQEAAPFAPLATEGLLGITGCEALSFAPSIAIDATNYQAGSPAGYDVNLQVPREETIEGLAAPDVRDVEVDLPEGTVISPSAANGLIGCTEAQFGLKRAGRGGCPNAADIGDVTITTPLLPQPLRGTVYVGEPECAQCGPRQAESGEMVRLLLEAEGSGVTIKLAGHTEINQTTGRLTTVFADNPQLPFTSVELALASGPDAPLVNQSSCGAAISRARVTPWSSPSAAVVSSPVVSITGCSTAAFAPSFQAGMTASAQAGGFSPFVVTLSRADGQQDFGAVQIQTPPGLLGMLSRVSLCGEAQANAGACPASSEIGSSSASVGPSSEPYTIDGGHVYLTGPYAGQPFGLAIVVPAQAGPFRLAGLDGDGNEGSGAVVVRASIAIDPTSAALTITSNTLPQKLDGIPLDIRQVQVSVDREGFMFNPTNCNTQSIKGTISSTAGIAASVSSTFQAVNCAALPFKPKFSSSAPGKTSRVDGASLTVEVASKGGPQADGSEANIKSVKVDLPQQLPSRLTTLQKACVAATFDANPASCPRASDVGVGTAVTPILTHPLSGPAYLVSHGGQAFPDLEIVLQGEGIVLILGGNTSIKKGVTSSTFKTVPDAPISSFKLYLPAGRYSALGPNLPASAKYSLCGQRLLMPAVITGQNGAVSKQSTAIEVQGCPSGISIVSHKLMGRNILLSVSVPAAGKLAASGNGLTSQSITSKGRETVKLALHTTKGGKLSTKVKLSFTPPNDRRQSKSLAVKFKR